MTDIKQLLDDFVGMSKNFYGEKLAKVILFGSYARGDYIDNSDVDIVLLLNVPAENETDDSRELMQQTFNLDLKYGINIKPIPKSLHNFTKWGDILPFYKNINREGLLIYERN